MRFSKTREANILLALEHDPVTCLTMNDGDYRRADGSIIIHRDNLAEGLHRYLYRRLVDPDLGRTRLRRACETWGCINPRHYRVGGPPPATTEQCPRGHLYLPGNLTESGHCLACLKDRLARRQTSEGRLDAATINALKTHCPHDHPYTKENTYLYRTPTGVHRLCRTCKLAQAKAWRTRRKEGVDTVRQFV